MDVPDGQDLWAAAQWNPLCTNTGASVFHLHRGELHEIELPGTSVSAVVGGSDGSIWAYGGDYLCAGPHSPSFWIRTPLLRVAPEGVIATRQHDIVSLAPMPTGGVLASKYSWNQPATGTWLHTTGEPIDAWTRISPLGADLSLLRDGTVWSRGNLGWGRILRYIPQGR